MRIGIDFDNTIAGYDRIFCDVARELGLVSQDFRGGKTEVKATLTRPGDESDWQKLQGLVYGRYMNRAELLPGAADFFLRSRKAGAEIFIVSHKTEFGHFDPDKVPLRDAAMAWMEAQNFFADDGFGLTRNHVFFEPTRAEKLSRIAQLRCDVFIDDLPEVLAEPDFPKGIASYLIGNAPTATDWFQIGNELFSR